MRGIGPKTIELLRTAIETGEATPEHFGYGTRQNKLSGLLEIRAVEWATPDTLRVTERGKALCANASELR